jgi:crotonobetainyl-CoA:carnitine CoA-transferase CaiB-like acyl-CoA transferase
VRRQVIKIELPPGGDEMRSYSPRLGEASANFALLNRGKRSIAADLKTSCQAAEVFELARECDVLIEQFRPGVMERLGFGYDVLATVNPKLIYCSISGYGADGDRARRAGHDLNYVAESGLLDLLRPDGDPVLPHALIADVGGGAYPAVINIVLGLFRRSVTGRGQHINVAIADGVFTFMYWALAEGFASGRWPAPNSGLITGGSPRYNLYATADARFIAVAALEDRFWSRFCDAIGLDLALCDDSLDAEATRRAVAARIAAEDAATWIRRLADLDVCCSLVLSLEEAVHTNPFLVTCRSIKVAGAGAGVDLRHRDRIIPALPIPIDPSFRQLGELASAPSLNDSSGIGWAS